MYWPPICRVERIRHPRRAVDRRLDPVRERLPAAAPRGRAAALRGRARRRGNEHERDAAAATSQALMRTGYRGFARRLDLGPRLARERRDVPAVHDHGVAARALELLDLVRRRQPQIGDRELARRARRRAGRARPRAASRRVRRRQARARRSPGRRGRAPSRPRPRRAPRRRSRARARAPRGAAPRAARRRRRASRRRAGTRRRRRRARSKRHVARARGSAATSPRAPPRDRRDDERLGSLCLGSSGGVGVLDRGDDGDAVALRDRVAETALRHPLAA